MTARRPPAPAAWAAAAVLALAGAPARAAAPAPPALPRPAAPAAAAPPARLAPVPAAAPAQEASQAAQRALGQQVYARCAGCHAIEGHRTGPQHCGLFGRRAGTAPGFDGYSAALRASGIVWDARTLDRFLQDPPGTVPGTAMGYAGVKDGHERAALIAWLREATQPGLACQPR